MENRSVALWVYWIYRSQMIPITVYKFFSINNITAQSSYYRLLPTSQGYFDRSITSYFYNSFLRFWKTVFLTNKFRNIILNFFRFRCLAITTYNRALLLVFPKLYFRGDKIKDAEYFKQLCTLRIPFVNSIEEFLTNSSYDAW